MRMVAIFQDTPAMADIRRRLEPAHLDYLRANVSEIALAGGLRDEPGSAHVGGLWIIEATSKERAAQLVEDDPYYKAEPRPCKLLVWGKALPDLKAVL